MQEQIKKIIHHEQVSFTAEMQKGCTPSYKQSERQKSQDHVIRYRKAFLKNPTSFYDLRKIKGTGIYINMINAVYCKSIANIKLKWRETQSIFTKLSNNSKSFTPSIPIFIQYLRDLWKNNKTTEGNQENINLKVFFFH